MRAKAEEAKIDLSSEQQVSISLYDVGRMIRVPIEIDVPFTRVQLQALIQPCSINATL